MSGRTRPDAPALTHLSRVARQRLTLVTFLSWLEGQGIRLPAGDALIDRYLKIDRAALEREQQALRGWRGEAIAEEKGIDHGTAHHP